MSSINMPFTGAGPMLLVLAKATLLLVAAIVATYSLRRSTAGARHLVWLAALVGVLALPVLSRIPALQLGVLPSRLGQTELTVVGPVASPGTPAPDANTPARVGRATTPVPTPEKAEAAELPVGGIATTVATPTIAPSVDANIAGWTYPVVTTLAIVWASVAFALLGWLIVGAIQVRRIVATARELTTPDWTMPLCEVADRLDLEMPPRLVLSDRIEMAFACRALAPTIVLPAAAESWTDDRRRAVLFHELAHVKRHDLLGHTLGRFACALYWFHPLVWTAAKNLRAESERACDDLVLSCGARPSEYAQHLLDMVTSVRNHGAPVMALPMARKKEFEGRMLAILDPAIRRASPGKLQAAGVIVSLAVLSLTVAAASPATATPRASEVATTETPQPTLAGGAINDSPKVEARPRMDQAPARDVNPNPTPTPSPTASPDPLARIVNGAAQLALNAIAPAIERAANQLGQAPAQAGDTAKITLLIRILETDTDATVRRTAAWGLNDVSGDRVRVALVKALKGDTDASVREMSAWALADHEGQDASSALVDALRQDKSARVRETAAWALGQNSPASAAGALEAAVSDSSSQVRHVAIWALGQYGRRAAPRGVVAALTDKSEQVRLVAAWALAEFEDKSVAQALTNAFQAETDSEVRSAELRALVVIGASTQAIVDVALKSSDPQLRRRAVGMLAGGDSGVWPWPWPWPQPRPYP